MIISAVLGTDAVLVVRPVPHWVMGRRPIAVGAPSQRARGLYGNNTAEKRGPQRRGPASISVDMRFDVDESGQASTKGTITVPLSLMASERDRLADVAKRTPVTLAIRTDRHGS